jgi:hypothetical protein
MLTVELAYEPKGRTFGVEKEAFVDLSEFGPGTGVNERAKKRQPLTHCIPAKM